MIENILQIILVFVAIALLGVCIKLTKELIQVRKLRETILVGIQKYGILSATQLKTHKDSGSLPDSQLTPPKKPYYKKRREEKQR